MFPVRQEQKFYIIFRRNSVLKSKSKLRFDRRSVDQSVLMSSIHLGPKTKFLMLIVAGLLMWGALSNKRTYRLWTLKHSDNCKFIYFRRRKTAKQHCLLGCYADVSSLIIFTCDSLRRWHESMKCRDRVYTDGCNTVRHPLSWTMISTYRHTSHPIISLTNRALSLSTPPPPAHIVRVHSFHRKPGHGPPLEIMRCARGVKGVRTEEF
jgi:hypothetical protein